MALPAVDHDVRVARRERADENHDERLMPARLIAFVSCALVSGTAPQAQGRGGAEWTTSGGDAQRSSWIRNDAKISKENLQKPGYFKFLWKLKLENEPKQLNSLTQPILLDRIIGFRGFKSVAFVGSSAETVYAIDTDFGTRALEGASQLRRELPPILAGTLWNARAV